MSLNGLDNEFLFALRTLGEKRNERELNVIYSRLYQLETLSHLKEQQLREICPLVRYESHEPEEILYKKDDQCRCWYVLMSGSVYIQGSMFLPYTCFGKQIPGTKRRGCQCLVLEPSEMLAIDYPDMAVHTGGITARPHAIRHSYINSGSQSTLDSVIEADMSSSEESPGHHSRSSSLPKTGTGRSLQMIDSESQSSLSKDLDEDDYSEQYLDEEDSISLHSASSIVIKDLVIDVLKKEGDRNTDDLEILMEFTKSLRAFSNMTEPTRRALCKVMVIAWVATANTIVLNDNEQLDSWSVIINGQVVIRDGDEEILLGMGDSFGVEPTLQAQNHKGVMSTVCDDCQFLCIAQDQYFDVLNQGKENIQNIYNEAGEIVMVKERRDFENGTKKGNIVIRGDAESLMEHMLEESAIDPTYTEDFLLTYRAFSNDPLQICSKLLEWFDKMMFRDKVSRIILLWVNNHFNDFEGDWRMMALLEQFEEKLHDFDLHGETKLFNIACAAKAKPRVVSIKRSSCEVDLGFDIAGGSELQFPIYISTVIEGSVAEIKGIKRGDQLLELNGQNFEKISFENAQALINKNTDLTLRLKTNLFAFKEMMAELMNPNQKSKKKGQNSRSFRATRMSSTLSLPSENENNDGKPKKGRPPMFEVKQDTALRSTGGTLGRATHKLKRMFKKESNFTDFVSKHGGVTQVTLDDSYLNISTRNLLPGSSATIDAASRSLRRSSNMSQSNPDLLEPVTFDYLPLPEIPEDVLKIYRADQSFRFIFVSRDTTAGDAAFAACKEFGITDDVEKYALYRFSVRGEKLVKSSKLPDQLSNLPDIPLGARYYLKKPLNSEQLLPDENIPELLKEANFTFLDLNCFELALYLTREDYRMFKLTEPTNFIDDLFHLPTELQQFKNFEDLVNQELFWVVTTMCQEQSAVQRSKIIKHFIKIANHCKILKNFNSTFALISGLGYRAVLRMKQSWERVPAKIVRQFEEMQALMDPSRNMSKYRTLLSEFTQEPPVIPYIPVVKKDLTFLHLGNDTKVDGLINFEKMRMIAKEVRNICRLCAPDHAQIIPSAAASQQKDEKTPIYQTLARRQKRSSLNNARRMYEDQTNVRRVRQYMKHIKIITDEEKLMEMSKTVEPQTAPSSAQTRRRNTSAALNADSPSRTSKTLPTQGRSGGSGSTGNLTSRNNSEPYLADVPIINTPGSKKKVPSSTLPKYGMGAHSPQLISRKLLSLSEDAKYSRRSFKKGGKEAKRSASVSSGSQDYSPTSSPFLTPKHQHKNKSSNADSNHNVGNENMNKNNNRLSLPAGTGLGPLPEQPSSIIAMKKLAANNNSAPPSCRSSIASVGSLGARSSSNPSISSSLGGSSSPRSSSPLPWGSNGSLSNAVANTSKMLQSHLRSGNVGVRSGFGPSHDPGNFTRYDYQERPVIKQTRNGRSSSFGGGTMLLSALSDKRLSQISCSTSSPALNANGPQAALILPNHPQIPRTASVDSGVVSGGSLSADSARFNLADENEIFARSMPEQNLPPQLLNQLPHHRHHQQKHIKDCVISDPRGSQASDNNHSPFPPSSRDPGEKTEQDNVEGTSVSSSQDQVDSPQHEMNILLPSKMQSSNANVLRQAQTPHSLGALSNARNVMGKGPVKGVHDFRCQHPAALRGHDHRTCVSDDQCNPVILSDHLESSVSTPEAILEEQLLMELQKQRPNGQNYKRRNTPVYEQSPNLTDLRSLSKSEPLLNNGHKCASLRTQPEGPISSLTQEGLSSVGNSSLPTQQYLDPPASQTTANVNYNPVTYQYHSSPDQFVMQNQSAVSSGRSCSASNQVSEVITSTSIAKYPCQSNTDPSALESLSNLEYLAEENSRLRHAKNTPKVPKENAAVSSMQEHYVSGLQQKRLSNGTSYTKRLTNGVANTDSMPLEYNVVDGNNLRKVSHQPLESHSQVLPNSRSNSVGTIADYAPISQPQRSAMDQRRRSQPTSNINLDWHEADLDVEKKQPTMRILEDKDITVSATPQISNPQRALPSDYLHHDLLHGTTVEAKRIASKPPPPPPKRKSSIGRAEQIRSRSIGSPSPPSSPPREQGSRRHGNETGSDPVSTETGTCRPARQQRNASFSSGMTSEAIQNYDRRSLPTYTEAIHQINSKQANSLLKCPSTDSYPSYSMDSRKRSEQISQV